MSQRRHTVTGYNPLAIWLLILLVLLAVVAVFAIIYLVAPTQQANRQARATTEARLAEASATATARQIEADAAAATLQAEVEQDYAAGLAFANAGDWQAAANAFRQVVALDAAYLDAPAQLAAALTQVETGAATATAQVVAMAAQVRADDQATADAAASATAQALAQLYAHAQGLMNMGFWPDAETELRIIFDAQPDYQQVQSLLATASAETAKLGPTRTPTESRTPTITPTPTATPSPTRTPAPTTDATATALAALHATQTAAAGPPPTPTPSATLRASPTPRPPTLTPDLTATSAFATAEALRNRPTWTPTPTPSHTPTPNLTATAAFLIAQAVGTAEALGLDPAGVYINPMDGALYLRVPAGPFIMGSDDGNADERPAHQVTLDEFWIKRTEVTNAEYARCVEAGGCTPPNNNRWQESRYADHPVVNVTLQQVIDYAAWAGGRLPTEAEWEKACRGPSTGSGAGRTYPWGEATPSADLLNFNGNVGDTTAVGSYPDGASPYGALDMAGNAREWTADWYDADYYSRSPASNPTGPDSGDYRVLRGGSYFMDAAGVGCGARYYDLNRIRNHGFRVVSSPLVVGR